MPVSACIPIALLGPLLMLCKSVYEGATQSWSFDQFCRHPISFALIVTHLDCQFLVSARSENLLRAIAISILETWASAMRKFSGIPKLLSRAHGQPIACVASSQRDRPPNLKIARSAPTSPATADSQPAPPGCPGKPCLTFNMKFW